MKNYFSFWEQESFLSGFNVLIIGSEVIGLGKELKPIVKKIEPGLYCAVRCKGMGVAMGSLLGEQVAKLIDL